MSLPKERITYLLDVYTSGKATVQEEQEFMAWIADAGEDSELKSYVQHLWRNPENQSFHYVNWNQMFNRIVRPEEKPAFTAPEPRVKRLPWWRIGAAAAVLLLVAGSYWLFSDKEQGNTSPVTAEAIPSIKEVHIPAPATSKAVITLADGRKIALESAGEGLLTTQSQTRLIRMRDGHIFYQATFGDLEARTLTNTITNPVGSRIIEVQLSEGTHIWLNAGSSITFPVKFAAMERTVAISGEAYFDVKSGARSPFIVKAGDMMVKVLGTRFNVNTFSKDKGKRVTLLDGAVRVSKGKDDVALKPGMQALVKDDSITVNSFSDADASIAWKNGYFSFKGATLGDVLEELARWYDIKVSYEGGAAIANRTFGGKIQRFADFSSVLRVLTENNVRYRINNRELTILP